ncbi:hypothetical protein V8D89_003642 [Ganoderma adspersum]
MHTIRQAVYSQFPDLPVSFIALRRCHHCGKSSDTTIQLKKCARCSRVLYCSKTCQKAEWPRHKLACHDHNDSLVASSDPVHPSLLTLADALLEFGEAHHWSFRSMAKALVSLNGGVDWLQNPQKILNLLLVPVPTTTGIPERNPARRFRISEHRFTLLDDHLASSPTAADDWARWEPLRKSVADMYGRHPNFAGVLPTMFYVGDMKGTFLEFYPLFRPMHPSGLTPLLADEQAKMALLQHVLALTTGTINAGIPLRAVEEFGPLSMVVALPGQFVRGQGASWTWMALFSSWAEYRRGEHGHLDDLLDTLNFHHSPAEIMVAFNML